MTATKPLSSVIFKFQEQVAKKLPRAPVAADVAYRDIQLQRQPVAQLVVAAVNEPLSMNLFNG
jgi:hypothetical protein